MSLGNWIINADKALFYFINKKLASPSIDTFLLLSRQAFTWIPVYFFFLLFFVSNSRKYILPIIVLSVFTFALTDFTSASILKPLIGRFRPCQSLSLGFEVRNIAGCGGIFSMPSSHASNHFGLSAFWFFLINHLYKSKWYWLWIWAALIGFAQIYVGVHFPADILTGAVLGLLAGSFTFYIFKKWTTKIDSYKLANE
jgi:undecaprenyl-diphosphatase